MKPKYNLADTTFLIPIRVDCNTRLRNIKLLTTYLLQNFVTNIIILERDKKQCINNSIKDKRIEYHYLKDKKKYLYITQSRNILTGLSKTPIIAIWDADFVVPTDQIIIAVNYIRNNKFQVVYPYNGMMYNTDIIQVSLFEKTLNTLFFSKLILQERLMHGNCLS